MSASSNPMALFRESIGALDNAVRLQEPGGVALRQAHEPAEVGHLQSAADPATPHPLLDQRVVLADDLGVVAREQDLGVTDSVLAARARLRTRT